MTVPLPTVAQAADERAVKADVAQAREEACKQAKEQLHQGGGIAAHHQVRNRWSARVPGARRRQCIPSAAARRHGGGLRTDNKVVRVMAPPLRPPAKRIRHARRFVGLGAHGPPTWPRNLYRAGLLTTVCDRTPEKSQALAAELGCHAAPTLATCRLKVDAVGHRCVSRPMPTYSHGRPAARASLKTAVSSSAARANPVSASDGTGARAWMVPRQRISRLPPVSGDAVEARGDATLCHHGGEGIRRPSNGHDRFCGHWARRSRILARWQRQAAKATNQIMCAGHH